MSTQESAITARDIMHQHYLLVDGFVTVADGIKLLCERNATVLVIKKRNENDEYGIVLPSDIAKKVLAPNRAAERINLYEIMSKPVIGVRPEMNVRYCARLFDQFGLALAPVIDHQHQVMGIVDYSTLVLHGLAPQHGICV
ncbi:CBS domain-containing protein [Halomonas vilamensis]|uniref:CBS domain-containing protein n=1 Tax=Vreelandella vilamensis TaxID=531309 RepID=A0ABU1H2C4_9GAMM|nr:CBS domain-containing protein [Halomonas vilamensis]MDR5898389.1 CBS domain-containing protein [Halomonas vilamensis]